MGANTLGILPLIKFLLEFINLNEMNVKEVVFADDFSVAGSLNSIEDYRENLTAIGPNYGYFPKPYEILPDSKRKKRWKEKTYLLIQEWISQLKEKDISVQLSGVQGIVTSMWKI